MSSQRPIISVNFDNDEELLEYVNGKGKRAEFIRYCIRKEMMDERKSIGNEQDLEARIEKILMKCLESYQPSLKEQIEIEIEKKEDVDLSIEVAASFFEED